MLITVIDCGSKIFTDIKNSGILSKIFAVSCAFCQKIINRKELTIDNVHPEFEIFACDVSKKQSQPILREIM